MAVCLKNYVTYALLHDIFSVLRIFHHFTSSFCVLVFDEADFKIPKASFSICNFGSRFSFLLGGPDCTELFGVSEIPSAPAASSLSSRSVVLLT